LSLNSIQYQEDYRSGYDDLVEDFFRASLRAAEMYWRAVGYSRTVAARADDLVTVERSVVSALQSIGRK
jgi:hypothetical protein